MCIRDRALAAAFQCGVNDLPLSLVLCWFEQKAVCILIALLALGIQNIRLGPTPVSYTHLSSYAFFMSSTGVWLEENMISLPEKPHTSLSISSVRDEQSTPCLLYTSRCV